MQLKRYARQCDVTGEGMNDGFVICDGAMYIKYSKHLREHITNDTNYHTIDEAYEDDYYYYTSWEDSDCEDDFQYEDSNLK